MDRLPERLLYRVEEAGQELGLSRATVFELLSSGELDSVTIGRSRRIPRQALEEFVARLRAGSPVEAA